MGLFGKIAKGFSNLVKGVGKAVTSPEGLLTVGAIAVGFATGGPVGAALAAKYAAIGGGALGVLGAVTGNKELASLGSNIALTGVVGLGVAGLAGGVQRASAVGALESAGGDVTGVGGFGEGFKRTVTGVDPVSQLSPAAVPPPVTAPAPAAVPPAVETGGGVAAPASPGGGTLAGRMETQLAPGPFAVSTSSQFTPQQLQETLKTFQPGNAKGWFKSLDPVFQVALLTGGTQVVGGILSGMSGADQLDLQEAMQEKELEFKREVRASSPGVKQFNFGTAQRKPLIGQVPIRGFQGAQQPITGRA